MTCRRILTLKRRHQLCIVLAFHDVSMQASQVQSPAAPQSNVANESGLFFFSLTKCCHHIFEKRLMSHFLMSLRLEGVVDDFKTVK